MGKKQGKKTKYFGHQPPQYDFFLNPHSDARFTRCPKCDSTTKLRKKPLMILIKPAQPVSLNKTCRYCPNCDLLIAHKDELDRLLKKISLQYYPNLVGNEYLVVGTLDRKTWKEGVQNPESLDDVLKPLHDFKRHLEFEPARYVWVKDDD
ncbi:hypothetical protein [Pseudanabaena sp. FACHB-2040]|uniref:hypothetical protein n=1 Tax=Pseudanabaena sp. FACHB-2040 TaxID=2692859 RepID=UPI00168536F2|nr:hypothetical protein [Pseudanabaena sp. FACHB-2040]MBD2256900.1 hypothetical protein [Pseudanabaena sp. FACHB-2040]